MSWQILAAAVLAVLIPVVVIRLRHANRTVNTILAEHHERMANDGYRPVRPARRGGRHRLAGSRRQARRGALRASGGYELHRPMSA
ncbi:MAG TPA: hypothetical protein VH352_15740 [Pseudonocardiaceae bacterium]|jgi:hypothetical protein|nr:hypothetical protein [Pseudonocardiaceae bacterium]